MRRKRTLGFLVAAFLIAAAYPAAAQAQPRKWTLILENIFRDGKMPMYIYASENNGQWIAAVGSSRDPNRMGGKTYNRSWYCGDLSGIPIKDGRVQGRFLMHMTPDLWVPLDHKGYTIEFEIDARIMGDNKLEGQHRIVAINTKDPTAANLGRQGKVTGTAKAEAQPPLPDPVTLEMNMQGSLVGGDPRYGGRCLVVLLGFDRGRPASAIHGLMSQKFEVYSKKAFPLEGCQVEIEGQKFSGRISVPTKTLDMEPCQYIFDIDGRVHNAVLVGKYDVTVKVEGKPDVEASGSFDGKWYQGITKMDAEDTRPWFSAVKGFKPPAPGEHPRLLFRKSDVPALRKKAQTPEGRAIVNRLRELLNVSDGASMTNTFNDSRKAYSRDTKKNPLPPGAYTMGHAAGYGLLYQLTGDKKYAQFGKQCFEKALAGVRDRDDRYSFRQPGGALRAGPSIGWYAVGYDLCYDGWDRATRERFGRALAEYDEGEAKRDAKSKLNLEALTRGTMPPGSNHFGMQVGGAALVLLAVDGESFVDQDRIGTLLKVVQQSTVRNLSEGFGDGGFFREGDGTGSMASQISFLPALSAWKNAAGKDFINTERPNARMLTLKWIYQTVFRDGRPDFWPIRGAYGHNVWSRQGVSGAGYFGIGLGGMRNDEKSAMKWCYNRFLLQADTAAGGPYDTVSPYPHHAVCSFVNWPVDLPEKQPKQALPLAYRDSTCDFYCWRNRWQDGNDTVITVLSSRTRGFMGAKPDRALRLNTNGQHLAWGEMAESPTVYWSMSPMGQTSSLTQDSGNSIAVDFTGASGADVMLVTTGKADGQQVKLGGKTLTFHFPTAEKPPKVETKGGAAVVGRQKITIDDGNLVLGVKGR